MSSSQQAVVASDDGAGTMDGDGDEDAETEGRGAEPEIDIGEEVERELEDDEIEDASSPVHRRTKGRKLTLLPFLKITAVAESSKGKGKSRRLVPATEMHQSGASHGA
jgi:hypothetical protein